MESISTLPAEIHASIAKYVGKQDLRNLCISSKRMKEIFLYILYSHVNLPSDLLNTVYVPKRQRQFFHTLMSRPEYGHHVRYLTGELFIPRFDDCQSVGEDVISVEEFWRVMQSLRRLQTLDIATALFYANRSKVPTKQFPNGFFRFLTSVRLVGHMQYGLAKSILNAIDPAALKDLCLDMVLDPEVRHPRGEIIPGDRGEDGRTIALGAMSGLLTTLTGRCTALRSLVLRREGQVHKDFCWHTAAENESYVEWASFIHSVRGTVATIMFEQIGEWQIKHRRGYNPPPSEIIMYERFRQLILPTIVSGDWRCLTAIELRGVRYLGEKVALKEELEAVLGRNTNIVVVEHIPKSCEPCWWPYC